MSPLMEQQQAMLAALFAPRAQQAVTTATPWVESIRRGDAGQWQRGLSAYRANGRALAVRALSAAYPTVLRLIGEENFGPLAHMLWVHHPPTRGDLAQWGHALPELIASLADLSEAEPHLADVARVEWALHRCASAPDVMASPASFSLLVEQDPDALWLRLAPGCSLIRSRWPVVDWLTQDAPPAATEAQTALVWRQGFAPRVRAAAPAEAPFLAALLQGHTLGAALKQAHEFDFGRWLPDAVHTGLLLQALILETEHESR